MRIEINCEDLEDGIRILNDVKNDVKNDMDEYLEGEVGDIIYTDFGLIEL